MLKAVRLRDIPATKKAIGRTREICSVDIEDIALADLEVTEAS